MHEIVFADANPSAVRAHNIGVAAAAALGVEFIGPHARLIRNSGVDWSDSNVTPGGVEVVALYVDEPEDREVQSMMTALGATAVTVRRSPFRQSTLTEYESCP